jgi:flagellar biosynthesis/type III secretory pathway chaperone
MEQLIQDLKSSLDLHRELLRVVEAEHAALTQDASESLFAHYSTKKALLPRLVASLDHLRQHRASWQKLSADARARHPEVTALLRQNQDDIMKILVLDRENEQALLRHGLVPRSETPSYRRQRPHFVAGLYQRQVPG